MRDGLTTTVTLLKAVPSAAADAAGLPVDKRSAGTVVKVRGTDAQELVAAGLARFGDGGNHGGTMGDHRLTVADVLTDPRMAGIGIPATDADREKYVPGRLSDASLRAAYVPTEQQKLRKWYAHLATRNASPAQIVCYGDSITEGTGSSTLTRRWQTILQRNLRARLDHNYGAIFPYIPARTVTTSPGAAVTVTGTANAVPGYGLGLRTYSLPDATGVLTFTFTGTRAKVLLTQGGITAVANITVDGGTASTLDTWNATTKSSGKIFDTGPLTAGAHTIVVKRDASSTAGRTLYVEGVLTYNGDEAAGIRVIDAGYHGIATQSLASASTATSNGQSILAMGGAGLLIVGYGTNDYGTNTPASVTANISGWVSGLRAAGWDGSVLYLAVYKGGGRPDALWDPYVAAIQGLADADPDGAFLDLGTRMPDPTNGAPYPLGLYFDSLHPSDAGHAYIADVLTGFLLPR